MLRRKRQGSAARDASEYTRILINARGIERSRPLWIHFLLGCALMGCGAWFFLWTEGKLLEKAISLDEGLQTITNIFDPSTPVLHENEGKLIHVIGSIEVGEPLTEFDYGISIPSIKLKKRVQMYQWVEEKVSRGEEREESLKSTHLEDGNVYYFTEWRDKLIDSSLFEQPYGHRNPKGFPFKTTIHVSEHVNVGSYYLTDALKDLFTHYTLVTSDERPEKKDIKLHSGLYYHSTNVWFPDVGDLRVQFSYAGLAGDVVSIVAKQVKHELHPYTTQNGRNLLIVRQGRHSIDEMFEDENKQNWFVSWCVRLFCAIFVFYGSSFLTHLLKNIGCVHRYSSVQNVLIYHSGSLNLSVTAIISFSIMSYTWISFAPILGGYLLLAAVCTLLSFLLYVIFSVRNKKSYRPI